MDKKKLLALAIFLIMGFFMVTFANPSDQLTPVDNNANEPVANNTNANQPTPTDNAQTRPTTPAANAGTTTNTPIVTPVVDDNTDTQPTNDDENNDPQVNVYTVTFVDHEGKALKIQAVAEHQDATASDITVLDYTVANMTYTFAKWDKDFTDVTTNLTVKALYNVKSIIAVVTIDGEKTDKTVEVYVNEDTENKKDVKLTEDSINDYINVDQLPEVNPGENNTVKELTYDEEDGYTIEIETEKIDYTVTTDDWTKVNGKHEITANIDDVITLTHEERDGYTFNEYKVVDGENEYTTKDNTIVVNTNDIEVYSEYTKEVYTIEYELNKGIVDGVNPTEYTVEDEFELINPTREGYIFLGWTEGNSQTLNKKVTFKKTTGNKVFTANWKAETGVKFHVTIREQQLDGTYLEYEDTTFKHVGYTDEERTIKAPKAKYGFELVSDSEVTITITFDGKANAVFTYNRVKFVVTFKAHEFTEIQRVTYEDAAATPTLAEANKDYNEAGRAFTFSQWGADYSKITGDTEVDAVYISSPITYNIVYKYTVEGKTNEDGTPVLGYFTDRENANQTNHATYNVTEEFNLVHPSKTGYDFVKWTDEEGNTVTKVSYEYNNKVLIAVLRPSTNNSYKVVSYAERLAINDEANTELERYFELAPSSYNYTVQNVTTGDSITVTPAAMTGFVTPAAKEETIAADGSTVYTFFYDRQEHTLTFKLNGNVMEGYPQTLKYGAAITAPELNAKEGYTLNGFGKVEETMGEKDLTYEATITPNTNTKYTVVVNEENVDGTTKTTRTTKTGTTGTTVTETQSAKEGFNLDATSKQVTITGDGKAEVVFNYTRIKSNLTFTVKATDTNAVETIKTVENVRYGEEIATYKPSYTVAAGYSFTDWNVTGTMPAEDTTIEAKVSPNTNTKYTVVVNEENVDGTTKTSRTEKTGTTGTTVTETQSAKEGFNLDATSKQVTITGDGKAEVEFNYTRIKSTLTFTIKDTDTNVVETIKTVENVPYGATIETYKPDYTAAEGYNFVDWNVTGKMPAEAKTIEATKNIKKFTVKWEIDGKVVETDENVKYNTKAIYNGQTPTKDGYTYLGWKDANGNDENVAIKANTTFKAQLVTLTAKIKANHQLSYTKSYNGNKPELVKEDITVTVVNLGGADKVLDKNEYTTDFNNTEFVKSKTLNITYTSGNLTLTNNKLRYSVIYLAYNSKFEVDVSIKNTFTYTIDDKCKGTDGQRCDRGDNVDEYTLDHNFLEVTEHYNQFVKVQSATVKYTDGSTKTLNLSDRVRWSYVENVIDEDNIYTISANESTITSGVDYPQNAYEKRKYSNYNEYYYVKKIGKCTSDVCKYYVATKAKGTYYSDVQYYAFDRDGDLALHKPKTKEGYHDPVYLAFRNNGYADVIDATHQIDTVTVRYHRDENEDDNETEGYFDVVFKYDSSVEGGFYCIDEHEVK